MNIPISRICRTLAAIVAMLVTVGCQPSYGSAPPPPEGTYTPEQFVAHFNTEMAKNKYRIDDWVKEKRAFRFRLPRIEVGDDTLSYEAGGFFTDSRKDLFVECSFVSTRPVRRISNGETVEIEGITVEAKLTWRRIMLKLANCQVERVDDTL